MKFLQKNLLLKLCLPVIGLMLTGAAIIYYLVPQMVEKNAQQNAIVSAEKMVKQFKTIRSYYTKNVIAKVLGNSDMKGSFNHRQESNAIPLPATFIHDLSALLKEEGTNIGLYSGFPFPNRKNRKLDEFQQSAWETLQNNPDGKVVRTEIVNGKQTVRVAMADKMVAEKCVGCHNSHPDTPKTGWKLGDTRGVLEVATIIDDRIQQGLTLGRNIVIILGLLLATISAAFYFIYRRTIGIRLDRTINITNKIADGDLTNEITVDSEDEIGHLQHAIKYLQDNSLKCMEMEAKEKKETEKYKLCLDQANTNLMIADTDLCIIYMNDAANELFINNETNFKKDLPNFNASKLIGTNIDVFYENPAHQRGILSNLTQTIEAELNIGTRIMKAIASPVNDENGNRLGIVVEWVDRTEEKARLESEAITNADNQRTKTALDQVNTNIMMADKDLNIIYMNGAANDLFSKNEAEFKTDLPNFNASQLIGTNIDTFHKNPAHQRGILSNITQTIEAELNIGTRIMKAIVSPVNDEDGNRLGTVVEWVDRTEEKARLESEAKDAAANGRVKTALDQVNSNVIMADADLNIIYMNKTATQLFNRNETDFRKDLPNFDAKQLIGANIDIFHKNPAHQRGILQNLTQTIEADLNIGGRSMRAIASPVSDDSGVRLGTVVEWIDRTDQVATEEEIDTIVQAASSGNFSKRIDETGKDAFFESLAVGINQIMETTDTSLNDVVRVLQSLSQGNLTQTIDADYEGLFGDLKSHLNTTVSKLSDVLGNVNSSVGSIANSSEEVSSTAQSLAQGASEQAASVEETSASIEQMSASINQNNENAKVTNDIASQSSTQAVEGGEAVKETVSAMNQIASKIGIIEDIAYQTNILALNAAIEAARAGEHGKGFAVVAAEVRKLAERSQISATEISDLASTSVTIAEKAGKLLEEIVPGINKTSGLVQEIAAASDEQASGAAQITNAMSQLDQVTQQTASASEELTATSEGMRNQSRSLLQQIGFFKLDESDEQVSNQRGPDRPFSSPAKDTEKFVADNHTDDAIDESHFSKFS